MRGACSRRRCNCSRRVGSGSGSARARTSTSMWWEVVGPPRRSDRRCSKKPWRSSASSSGAATCITGARTSRWRTPDCGTCRTNRPRSGWAYPASGPVPRPAGSRTSSSPPSPSRNSSRPSTEVAAGADRASADCRLLRPGPGGRGGPRARTVPLGSRRPARQRRTAGPLGLRGRHPVRHAGGDRPLVQVGGDQQLPFIAWAEKTLLPALREL